MKTLKKIYYTDNFVTIDKYNEFYQNTTNNKS